MGVIHRNPLRLDDDLYQRRDPGLPGRLLQRPVYRPADSRHPYQITHHDFPAAGQRERHHRPPVLRGLLLH